MKSKFTFWLLFILLITWVLSGCTAQKPISQAPAYNITYTDNSQLIIGNDNQAHSKPDTTTSQVAKPTTESTADNTTSNMWIYWVFITIALGVAGYFIYRKIKK